LTSTWNDRTAVSVLVALLLIAATAGSSDGVEPTLSASGVGRLDELLDAAVYRGDVPAVVVAIVGASGPLHVHGAGSREDAAGSSPVGADTLFRIFSMTKPITSVAAMMLVEEGKLRLDDPVGNYLPGLASVQVLERIDEDGRVVTRPPKRPLTVRHLLTQTSGIGYAFSNRDESRLRKILDKPETELPLVHDPGERWTYGPGTKLLGDVIENVSGEPLDRFLKERILDPLAMTDTSFDVPESKRARVATVHSRGGSGLAEQPNPSTFAPQVRGDYGLYSTAADYGRFVRMLLDRGRLGDVRILTPETVVAMTRNQIGSVRVEEQPALSPELSLAFPRLEGEDTFGLGFQIAAPARPNPARRAKGSYGWSGVMNTYFWVDPERQIAVVALMQVLPFGDPACAALMEQIEQAVYDGLNGDESRGRGAPVPQAASPVQGIENRP
jgi:methyl acetate hydrolase